MRCYCSIDLTRNLLNSSHFLRKRFVHISLTQGVPQLELLKPSQLLSTLTNLSWSFFKKTKKTRIVVHKNSNFRNVISCQTETGSVFIASKENIAWIVLNPVCWNLKCRLPAVYNTSNFILNHTTAAVSKLTSTIVAESDSFQLLQEIFRRFID